jgi:hypothetical protein
MNNTTHAPFESEEDHHDPLTPKPPRVQPRERDHADIVIGKP